MERIIITLDRNGKFRGASAQDWDGMPVPVDADWLNGFAPELNAATLVRIAELEADAATKADELTALQTAHSEALAAKDIEREAAVRAAVEAIVPPEPTEITIKAWQAKAILAMQGLLELAEKTIDSLPEPQRTIVMSAWTNNADFPRSSQTILALAAELKLTDATLDAMFAAGAELAV